ncbi:MAG: TetR/AcrR family transcriptional regulator [Solirubrobacterales bacterium]
MPRPVSPSSFAEFRLPRGRHGIPPERVEASQRWRLLGSCAEAVAEGGYGALTVTGISAAAAVSKGTFYQQFDGLDGCILATYEMASAIVLAAASEGCDSASDPTLALSAAASSVLELLAQEPALGHVLTDAALDDVQGLFPAREEFVRRCASALVRVAGDPSDPSRQCHLSLHRVRATKGWLSLLLRAGGSAALPGRASELAQLLSS